VALIGRTALGPDSRRFHALSRAEREAEKDVIRERLARDGHAKVTPVMVDKAHAALERAAEIHDTVAALAAAGAHVTYHEADVCDCARLENVLAEIRRVHGPITTLIHGAGVEVSRTLEKKSLEEFQSVHRPKTLGAWNLSWLCREDPLHQVVAISSIAGRFGSPAQVDYSAANGFLDLWARMYQHRRGARGTSLIWSAWAEQGMAWRSPFVRENAERSGLGFIEPGVGARAAVDEIVAGSADVEVVLHRGLGEVGDPELMGADPGGSPFIDWCERGADGATTFGRRFSARRDAMLDQHRLGSTPLMPGVGLMEMMAEAHALTTEQHQGALVFRELEFAHALKFYRDEARDVQVRIAPTAAQPDGALTMQAWSPFRSPVGAVVEERLYARALVSREAANPLDESPVSWSLGACERMTFKRALAPAPSLKQGIELGPLLNDVGRPGHDPASSEVLLGEIGIVTRIPFPRAQLSEPRYPHARLHANPAFLDCMHQAAAVFCVLKTGAIHLPVGAQEFTVFEAPNQDARYEVIARIRDRLPDRMVFDVALLREGGTLCCFARKVVLRRTGQ
jgi:NAD(P)-dependent dehydrogenase (short-subunit alcohol dehydrogenase family)